MKKQACICFLWYVHTEQYRRVEKLRVTAHQLLVLEDFPRLSSLNNRDVTIYRILWYCNKECLIFRCHFLNIRVSLVRQYNQREGGTATGCCIVVQVYIVQWLLCVCHGWLLLFNCWRRAKISLLKTNCIQIINAVHITFIVKGHLFLFFKITSKIS